MWRRVCICLCIASLGACGDDRVEVFEGALDVVGPVAVDKRFVYLNQSAGELLFVTPGFEGADLTFTTAHRVVGSDPVGIHTSDDGELIYVINGGDQTLSIVEVQTMEEHRFELPSDYDTVTVDPTGRFVVAHYRDASAGGSGDSVFRNENGITVFDIDPDGVGGEDRLEQVDSTVLSLRSSPLGFDFAPPFEVDGIEHHILVVHAQSALALVDMTASDEVNRQRRLFFVPEDSTEVLLPQTVLFTEDDTSDDSDMKMFVLTSNARDIFEVSILPPGVEDETELALSINQFPAGRTPVEMAYFTDLENEKKLLVLGGSSREMVVVDIATGNTTDLSVDWDLSESLTYQLVDEDTGQVTNHALLWSPNGRTLIFADLDELESRGTRALTALVLSRAIASIDMLPGVGADKAIVVHSGHSAISVLDLPRKYDIPLPGSATLENLAFSPGGDRVFVTVAELPVMASIELATGHPSQIDITQPGGQIAILDDPQVLLIDHGADEGRITLMNGVEPDPETSALGNAIFFEDLVGLAERAGGEQ